MFVGVVMVGVCLFLQAEDGVRDGSPSRGLGDVYEGRICWWLFVVC